MRPRLVDVVLLALTCALAAGLTRAYVSAEQDFYFWDFGAHWDLASGTAQAFGRSPEEGLRFVEDSLDRSYNALFALPLVPLLAWWGTSRVAYEQALSLVCFVPLPLTVGALAARLARESRRAAFWSAAGLTLLTPLAWIPTLNGYPDSAAASLVCLAVWAWLADPKMLRARTPLAAGTLVALATLLRRHFAYAALALGLALALRALGEALLAPRGSRGAALRQTAGRLGLFALAGWTTGGLLAPAFLRRALEYDFRSLHQSYENPFELQWAAVAENYGLAFLLAAAAGLWRGLRSRRIERQGLATVAAYGALQALLWALAVRQVGEQYTLHVTPALVLCAWALAWSTTSPRRRALCAAGLGLLGAVNLWLGLAVRDPWASSPARLLLAANWPPRRHPGYDAVLGLVRDLRSSPLASRPVFVAASSFCLNPDMLRRADRLVRGRGQPLDVRNAPEVDSSTSYPLGRLLDAGLVVVGQPVQLHLPPESQRLVSRTVDLFLRPSDLAADFEPWPQPVPLVCCAARVFQRRRETSLASALATLDQFESALAGRPGLQPDWSVVERAFPSWLTRLPDGSASWTAHPAPASGAGATRLASLSPAGRALVSGTVHFLDARCPGVTLELAGLYPGPELKPLAAARQRPGEAGAFALGVDLAPATRLVLSLLPYSAEASIDYCLLTIAPLELRPMGGADEASGP